MTGLSIHALRYYEKEGIIRRVDRTPGGRRVYSEECASMVVGALCLKDAGMTLPQIKEFFDMTAEGNATLPQRLDMLRTARANLQEQQRQLELNLKFVEFVISYFKGAIGAAKDGQDPEATHPFMTVEGAFKFPTARAEDGRLHPFVPELVRMLED